MFGIISLEVFHDEYIAGVREKVRESTSMSSVENAWALVYGTDVFENENIAVVADSDIYNFHELAGSSLEPYHNASELIATLYQKSGTDLFERIRGPFSVCILDKKTKTFIIATDRFGIRPIVYSCDKNILSFGGRINEINLLGDPSHEGIDNEAVVDYLNLGAIPTPKTIYRNIRKLSPGHFLMVSEGRVSPKITKYYDIQYSLSSDDESYFISRVPLFIEEAVKSIVDHEMRSDRKIGAFLSGGTDSSTVCGMIKKISGHVKTFSIGFDEPGYNELDYARLTANYFGAEHYEYMVSPDDVLNALGLIVDAFDEPFGNASAIPTYFCALLAKKSGVDSLLAGDGGDEVFGGNERYAASRIFDLYYTIPSFLRSSIIEPLVGFAPSFVPLFSKGKKYIRRAKLKQPERFFSYHPVNTLGIENIFSKNLLSSLNDYDSISWAKDLYKNVRAEEELSKLLYIDMKFTITDNDLRKVNNMSAAAGVKVRYPFLNYNLVDFAASIPASMKIKGTKLRYIFKKSMKNFLLDETISKQKHGFGLPIGVWIRSKKNINSFVRDALLSTDCKIRTLFRSDFPERLFQLHDSTGASFYGDIIYHVLMLELWSRKNNINY